MARFKFIILLFILFPTLVQSQYFGKNKVQYQDFEWKYIQTEHFDIYFTEGGEDIATFVAEISEASYKRLKASFRFDLIDRITIIAYNSHNDFGQTNVDLSPPEESVGGFTEFFKNRVVLPFDGSWEQFRHVIHHELTHAVMLQMLYGSGVQSIISGMSRLRLPLWMIEGLAEFESREWDTESDMYLRDAALNTYVPDIDRLYGFMAYKGGQSVLYYLAEKYGKEKIGELIGKIKVTKNVDQGFKQSIGIGTEELTDKWHLYLKREYWPDIADRKEPGEFARKMTDHVKEQNFVNSGPALSPKGDKMVFLSDRDNYFDIYLMSAIDGKIISKLVSGERSGNLEELKWLRAGISWSPDGNYIVFAAKAGDSDALHIFDVKEEDMSQTIKLDLDGIFSPVWSPKGDEIAFMGTQNGQGDIFSYHLKTKKLRQITDDVFSDLEPAWSPDGERLAFISDRGGYISQEDIPENFEIYYSDFYNYDVYTIRQDGSEIQRITRTRGNEQSPVFSPDGTRLAYTSDRSGIYNIYVNNLETGVEYPITNVLTGIFHLSWEGDSDKMAFAAFYK
ncbi:biopolymer transporter Tol, partial [candidate division KSB1 bacterium]|nr:biopolymer transporter Tol [candidate division KSB1 bacterium]